MFGKFKLSYIREHPLDSMSVVFALVLIALGLFVCVPAEWLGITSAYPSQIARSVFGALMMTPAVPTIWRHFRSRTSKRLWLFWMLVTYLYLAIFRIMAVGVFPPLWVLYIASAFVLAIIWLAKR